MPEGGDYGRNM